MVVPPEFTPDAVKAASPRSAYLPSYNFLKSGEPYRSMLGNNPWMDVNIAKPLEWGKGKYFDTTVARKHPYWKDRDLPRPTKDMQRMRNDLCKWGYCLIEEAFSEPQYSHMRRRLLEQAEAERLAGLTPWVHRENQMVYTLVNKGWCFAQAIEHHPDAVQAGPVIEQLLTESLGEGFICNSFQALIAHPGGTPQNLHQDQGASHPMQTPGAPLLFSTLFFFDDINEMNGGTLVIPGSHRLVAESGSGSGGEVPQLPPAINLEAPAGSALVFDGRLLHGTGVNRTSAPRHLCIMSFIRPWMRSQDLWPLVVAPEVLRRASPKLLQRLCFQAANVGVVEGQGILGTGRAGDPKGSIKEFREAMDAGRYLRVGELAPGGAEEALRRDYTFRGTDMGRRALRRLEKQRRARL